MPAGLLVLAGTRSEVPSVRELCLHSLLPSLLTGSARAASKVGCACPAASPPVFGARRQGNNLGVQEGNGVP